MYKYIYHSLNDYAHFSSLISLIYFANLKGEIVFSNAKFKLSVVSAIKLDHKVEESKRIDVMKGSEVDLKLESNEEETVISTWVQQARIRVREHFAVLIDHPTEFSAILERCRPSLELLPCLGYPTLSKVTLIKIFTFMNAIVIPHSI